jgi:hypothetical protein
MTSRLQYLFKRCGEFFRYNGLMGLLWQLLQRGVQRFGELDLVTFFVKDLSQPIKEVKKPANLTITLATESDIEPLFELLRDQHKTWEFSRMKEYQDLVLRRLQRGCLCFLGRTGQEIIHYNWISFHWERSWGGRFMHLKNDEAYCLDGFTSDRWRGKGIHPTVHYQMLHYLRQHGYLKAYTIVKTDDRSSKKTHQLFDWSTLGIIFCFTPRGASKGWILTLKGDLADFLKEQIPDLS